jgi:ATP-dependent RNA helicase SUPV3L1/SUV3
MTQEANRAEPDEAAIAKRYDAEPYGEDEINAYGDVDFVKLGWLEIPLRDSRGAPLRYTVVVRWGGTRRYPKPIKRALVPQKWWQEKLAKRASRSSRRPLTAEQLQERRLARRLQMPVKELRATSQGQRQLLECLAHSFDVNGKEVLGRLNGFDERLFEYRSFFAANREGRQAQFFAGPTNSGKTHAALDALAAVPSGVYLAPLRLMALEGQEELARRGVRCSLITGEERDLVEGATHVACTIEMLDPRQSYDAAVIDEIQLLADPDRGPAWTRALFGVRAPRVVLTGDPGAEPLLRRLATEANLDLEVLYFERKNELRLLDRCLHADALDNLPPGTAVIAFSRRSVLALRNNLVQAGRAVAVLYGSLGPTVRRVESRRFRTGQADLLVATDVIGMGLNLPIKTLYFWEHEKYDGTCTRRLRPWEVRQISGRAGRFGHADAGYFGGVGEATHEHLGRAMESALDGEIFAHAIAGPTVEHIEAIATIVGTSSIASILKFYVEHVRFSSPDLRMGKLKDILLNAFSVDSSARNQPVASKWILACAPVPTGDKCKQEKTCFRAILAGIDSNRPIGVEDACSLVRELPRLELGMLEVLVVQLTIYIWVAFRFPELVPERSRAEDLRDQANSLIASLLTKEKHIPIFVTSSHGHHRSVYSADELDDYDDYGWYEDE